MHPAVWMLICCAVYASGINLAPASASGKQYLMKIKSKHKDKSEEEVYTSRGADYKDTIQDYKNSGHDYKDYVEESEDVMKIMTEEVDSELKSLSNGFVHKAFIFMLNGGMEFEWDDAEKKDKICKALERGDTLLDLLLGSDCDEDSSYCLYLKRGKRDIQASCFDSDPLGDEEKIYCRKIKDFFDLRKEHCGVDTIQKYYTNTG